MLRNYHTTDTNIDEMTNGIKRQKKEQKQHTQTVTN